ncbi:hypothetical protein JOB18_003196 [Solea senegalensis]|uniref:Uncharacterized protein n=1 Tax=Solea senegalensis TaxID=28829 RepID=A0AAV6RFM0_SOLSE|nr:hypothetical protein JOB18_003196 [Solea senegalensis]
MDQEEEEEEEEEVQGSNLIDTTTVLLRPCRHAPKVKFALLSGENINEMSSIFFLSVITEVFIMESGSHMDVDARLDVSFCRCRDILVWTEMMEQQKSRTPAEPRHEHS